MSREVRITHPDKVLFPEAGVTKADLAAYYERVADRMLPHLRGRALVMERYPEGVDAAGFFHKEAPEHFPDWIERATLAKEGGGATTYVVANDADTLVYLVGQNTVTPHVWLSPVEAPDRPDQLVFDLDPGSDRSAVPLAARAVRDALDELGLPAFAKSSGSKGVHVHVPLDGSADFGTARRFARGLAEVVASRHPDVLTTASRKASRGGRLYLDVARNGYAQHAVAPYAVRARPEAPVAVPLDWGEATSADFDARAFTVRNVFRRLGRKRDPWEEWDRAAVSLSRAA